MYRSIPDATVDRLSLYHCYLGERARMGILEQKITSRRLAEELNLREETVRRDLSFVGGLGRPGSGYEAPKMLEELQEFLGLTDRYPIIKVGTAETLEAIRVVFPPDSYGVSPVAYYSENESDVGKVVNDIEIRHIHEIPEIDRSLGVSVALVACTPPSVQKILDLLHAGGITGVMLLTPSVKVKKPEGMTLTHVRMPCDIKSLACRCRLSVEA